MYEATEFSVKSVGEVLDLGRFPFDKNFHAAIREVSHIPDQLETPSQPAAGRPKTHTLNPAGICHAPSFQGHEFATLHEDRGKLPARIRSPTRAIDNKYPS